MKFYKLCFSVLLLVLVCFVMLSAIDLLTAFLQSAQRAPTAVGATMVRLQDVDAFPSAGAMQPGHWLLVFAVLFLDVGCVVWYRHRQRRKQWWRRYWQQVEAENQRFLDLLSEVDAIERRIVRPYALTETNREGRFYLVIKPKKAPAHYVPALFL